MEAVLERPRARKKERTRERDTNREEARPPERTEPARDRPREGLPAQPSVSPASKAVDEDSELSPPSTETPFEDSGALSSLDVGAGRALGVSSFLHSSPTAGQAHGQILANSLQLYPDDPSYNFSAVNGPAASYLDQSVSPESALSYPSLRTSDSDRERDSDWQHLPSYASPSYPSVPAFYQPPARVSFTQRPPQPRDEAPEPSAPLIESWDEYHDIAAHYEYYYGLASSFYPTEDRSDLRMREEQQPGTASSPLGTLSGIASAAGSSAVAAGAYLTPLAVDLARSVWSAMSGFRDSDWDPAVREQVERLRENVEALAREVRWPWHGGHASLFNRLFKIYPPLRNATKVTISSLISMASSANAVQGPTLYPPIPADAPTQPARTLTASDVASAAASTALNLGTKGAVLAGTAAVSLATMAVQNVPPLTAKLIHLLNTSQLPPALVAGIWNSSRTVAGVLAYLQAMMVEYGKRELNRRRHKQNGGVGMVVMDDGHADAEEGDWLVVGGKRGSREDVSGLFMEPGGI